MGIFCKPLTKVNVTKGKTCKSYLFHANKISIQISLRTNLSLHGCSILSPVVVIDADNSGSAKLTKKYPEKRLRNELKWQIGQRLYVINYI